MKKIGSIFFLLTVLLISVNAEADLIDNGDGTITQIRNDGSMLMWLQDAYYARTSGYINQGWMTWNEADSWASNLSFADHDDWRLPSTLPVNGDGTIPDSSLAYDFNISYDGSTDRGYNITSLHSEMSYMFYVELGNKGDYDIYGNSSQPGWGLTNPGPFLNIYSATGAHHYWSNALPQPHTDMSMSFDFYNGHQTELSWFNSGNAWAVRTISTSVIPEPISSILFLTGGAIFAGRRYLGRGKFYKKFRGRLKN